LPPLHAQILGDQLGAEALVLQQGKAHAEPLEDLLEFPQFVPEQVAAEMLVEFVHRDNIRVGEQRRDARRLQHIDQDQVLPANQFNVAHEAFGQEGIIQRSKEYQKRAAAQAQAQESAELVEIGRDDARLERIERVPAGAVMGLAVFGADEVLDLVAEREEANKIALLFSGEAQ